MRVLMVLPPSSADRRREHSCLNPRRLNRTCPRGRVRPALILHFPYSADVNAVHSETGRALGVGGLDVRDAGPES